MDFRYDFRDCRYINSYTYGAASRRHLRWRCGFILSLSPPRLTVNRGWPATQTAWLYTRFSRLYCFSASSLLHLLLLYLWSSHSSSPWAFPLAINLPAQPQNGVTGSLPLFPFLSYPSFSSHSTPMDHNTGSWNERCVGPSRFLAAHAPSILFALLLCEKDGEIKKKTQRGKERAGSSSIYWECLTAYVKLAKW